MQRKWWLESKLSAPKIQEKLKSLTPQKLKNENVGNNTSEVDWISNNWTATITMLKKKRFCILGVLEQFWAFWFSSIVRLQWIFCEKKTLEFTQNIK